MRTSLLLLVAAPAFFHLLLILSTPVLAAEPPPQFGQKDSGFENGIATGPLEPSLELCKAIEESGDTTVNTLESSIVKLTDQRVQLAAERGEKSTEVKRLREKETSGGGLSSGEAGALSRSKQRLAELDDIIAVVTLHFRGLELEVEAITTLRTSVCPGVKELVDLTNTLGPEERDYLVSYISPKAMKSYGADVCDVVGSADGESVAKRLIGPKSSGLVSFCSPPPAGIGALVGALALPVVQGLGDFLQSRAKEWPSPSLVDTSVTLPPQQTEPRRNAARTLGSFQDSCRMETSRLR